MLSLEPNYCEHRSLHLLGEWGFSCWSGVRSLGLVSDWGFSRSVSEGCTRESLSVGDGSFSGVASGDNVFSGVTFDEEVFIGVSLLLEDGSFTLRGFLERSVSTEARGSLVAKNKEGVLC